MFFFKRFVDRPSRYNRVKKTQLDAQIILSIFRQPLRVSGVSRPIIRRYNHMYTTICTFNPTSTTDSHLKRIISTNCYIRTVVPPDDGPTYGRNMCRLTKYTKNKLCIKLVFFYRMISCSCSTLALTQAVYN